MYEYSKVYGRARVVGARDKERLAAPVAVCLGWLGRI
jgi:hypothetical protein